MAESRLQPGIAAAAGAIGADIARDRDPCAADDRGVYPECGGLLWGVYGVGPAAGGI